MKCHLLKIDLNKYFHFFSREKIASLVSTTDLRIRIGWYIKLRWLAIIGVLAAIPINYALLHFNVAVKELLVIVLAMAFLNLLLFFLWRHLQLINDISVLAFTEIQIIIDLIIISLLVHFSGGIQNPFVFLFVIQVILSGIFFPGAILPYVNAGIASILLTFIALSEFSGIIPQYNIRGEVSSVTYLITVILSFYVVSFSGVYIINNSLKKYQVLRRIVDEKTNQLEHVIEERNKAFRFAAHELKSPMVAIKSSLDLVLSLHSEDMTPDTKNMVLKANRRTDQIINMVKEMITISQYSQGTQKQEIVTVEYDEWLTNLVLTFVDNALKKRIVLSIVHLNDNFVIDLDKSGLESVIRNLVSNAIRYTPSGGKVFVISFRKTNCFGFSVKDTGIGISDEEKANIFSEFYRSKKAREMEQIGTGLGLNLVKEIVKINNGTITVESEIDKGSIFTVEFPLPNIESPEFEYRLITKPNIFE